MKETSAMQESLKSSVICTLSCGLWTFCYRMTTSTSTQPCGSKVTVSATLTMKSGFSMQAKKTTFVRMLLNDDPPLTFI
jgi:hypothetical protein